jgi:hypothetical protein
MKRIDENESKPEPAVWSAMPAGQQNAANVFARVVALIQLVWLWLRDRLGTSTKRS